MNIVVLAAGTSTERDVSIVTSTMVCASLRRNGHKANMIDVFMGTHDYQSSSDFFNDDNDLNELADNMKSMTLEIQAEVKTRRMQGKPFFGNNVLEFCKDADIVFMGLHGSNGEDGKVQAAFDLLGIKYTGTDYLSSAISMDKDITKKVLMAEGIPMPKGIMLKKGHRAEYVPFPCVVKPCCGGSSVGVSIAKNQEEYEKAVEEAFEYEDSILVEQFIESREFSVGVIDGKAVPVVEIVPKTGFYDYENKYSVTGADHICPANIPQDTANQMMRWAEKACEAAGISTYARVDELIDKDGKIYCLEINTLPGMTETSLLPYEAKAVGISYDELTNKIIDISMKKYEE